MTEVSYNIQFPIGKDAATIIQDETAWPDDRLIEERGYAVTRLKSLDALRDNATDADKEYAGQSTRITGLVDNELLRRDEERKKKKVGGRRRKARSTKGRKTRARRRRHTRRY